MLLKENTESISTEMDTLVEKVVSEICSVGKHCRRYILGYLSQLERATGRDYNGDGILGRRPDVIPGYPAAAGYPSMMYGPTGQVYATNGFVAPNSALGQPHMHHHHHHSHMHHHF